MAEYDPIYVEFLANELMRKAKGEPLVRAAIGIFVGAAIGYVVAQTLVYQIGQNSLWEKSGTIIIGALLFGIFGFLSAQSTSLRMRADAYLMLTQLNIEINTRGLRHLAAKKKEAASTVPASAPASVTTLTPEPTFAPVETAPAASQNSIANPSHF